MSSYKRISLIFYLQNDSHDADQFIGAVQLFVKNNFGVKDNQMEKHVKTVFRNNERNERTNEEMKDGRNK